MKLMRETALFFMRSLRHAVREPIWVFLNLIQPLLYLFLFMPLLEGLGGAPGLPEGRTAQVFVPGLLVMLAMFGTAFVGYGLLDEIRTGVIDRFLATPVRRVSIMLGRVLKDVAVLLAQCIVVTLVSLPFGLELSLGGFLISLLLYTFIGISMASMSYGFALLYKSDDTLSTTLQMIAMPISVLSGIMLPLALAPLWIRLLAGANPFSYAVNASRALFAGEIWSWNVLTGFAIVIALAALMFWWAVRQLKKMAV